MTNRTYKAWFTIGKKNWRYRISQKSLTNLSSCVNNRPGMTGQWIQIDRCWLENKSYISWLSSSSSPPLQQFFLSYWLFKEWVSRKNVEHMMKPHANIPILIERNEVRRRKIEIKKKKARNLYVLIDNTKREANRGTWKTEIGYEW